MPLVAVASALCIRVAQRRPESRCSRCPRNCSSNIAELKAPKPCHSADSGKDFFVPPTSFVPNAFVDLPKALIQLLDRDREIHCVVWTKTKNADHFSGFT